ncbi:thioesterase family protein [Nocardia sp. XZ_19_385]|uniref:thioesterase family protein n=1 Tax=Nocardia sp. XZ_19_385 TaxID=2769488 RepID=UPI001890A23F|nr:thioesterase family protein [Nocardia sp. XZ_19_385]
MGDLGLDTAVDGAAGQYAATLSPDWEAWGPVGGYLAALAVRAAREHGELPHVASATCQFLSVAEFGPVQLTAETLRAGRRAESIQVRMTQRGKPILAALVWLSADGLDAGVHHDVARMPMAPPPEGLRSWDDLTVPMPSVWKSVEGRPVVWHEHWNERPLGAPEWQGWFRFRPGCTDPAADAARQLILLDLMPYQALLAAHREQLLAPNLDLSVQFHRTGPVDDWLFAEASCDIVESGLAGFRSRVWSRDGQLLASGSGQLLCRLMPAAPI